MTFVYMIMACVLVGVGATLTPPIRSVSTTIFDAFGGTAGMHPFLVLIVNLWPVFILLFFVVGAFYLVRGRA